MTNADQHAVHRSPTRARTTIADYVIFVTLRDCLTTAESNLLTARGNVALYEAKGARCSATG